MNYLCISSLVDIRNGCSAAVDLCRGGSPDRARRAPGEPVGAGQNDETPANTATIHLTADSPFQGESKLPGFLENQKIPNGHFCWKTKSIGYVVEHQKNSPERARKPTLKLGKFSAAAVYETHFVLCHVPSQIRNIKVPNP
jgi:hypothetical protein